MKHKRVQNILWFALYTRSRAEKRVAFRLNESGYEVYLPLYKRMKVWSDRKKMVEEPLFNGYLFVHIVQKELHQVLETDGVVRVISFEGQPVPIPEKQINAIKAILKSGRELVVVNEIFTPGDRVVITGGAMNGIEGCLTQRCGKYKLIVCIEALNRSIFVTVTANVVKKV